MSKSGKDALFNSSVGRANFKNVIAKRSDLVRLSGGRLVAPAAGGGGAVTEATLHAGQVLGQVTATKRWKAYDPLAVDGSEVAKGVLRDTADYDSDDDGTSIAVITGGALLKDLLIGLDAAAIASLRGVQYSEQGVNIIEIG